MNLVVVAGRDVKVNSDIASKVLAQYAAMDDESMIHVRATQSGNIVAPVEQMAAAAAKSFPFQVCTHRPNTIGGRAGIYNRDYQLVDEADLVLAFFTSEHVMAGGTGHVVEAALARNVPVRAWTWDEELCLIGSDDGVYSSWDGIYPSAVISPGVATTIENLIKMKLMSVLSINEVREYLDSRT